jgi:hypothetical protein
MEDRNPVESGICGLFTYFSLVVSSSWSLSCLFVVTMRLVGEVSECEFLFLLGAVFFRDGSVPLASQRHAERLGLLALLDVPP